MLTLTLGDDCRMQNVGVTCLIVHVTLILSFLLISFKKIDLQEETMDRPPICSPPDGIYASKALVVACKMFLSY